MNSKKIYGTVLEIQRMSTEDGPGIRTTVFFKGCSLRCLWCHNPESISPKPQLQWVGSRCIGCKTCLEVCPNGALSASTEGISIDRDRCQACGQCAEECPSTALELMGKRWTVEDLVQEVGKDRVYFEKSGGGITASGGEAAMQADFISAFLAGCQEKGMNTAIDTCGYYPVQALETILPHTDLILFDIKEIDPARHKEFTGHDNRLILDNLLYLSHLIEKTNPQKELWIRTPIIPGATDTRENISGIGRFIATKLKNRIGRWELCSFNNLCRDKYLRLGLDWKFMKTELLTAEAMENLSQIAKKSGVAPDLVHWSGATRLEDEEERPKLRLVKGAV